VVVDRVKHLCADESMRRRILGRMAEVEPAVAAAVQESRTTNEEQRAKLRAEAASLISNRPRKHGPGNTGRLTRTCAVAAVRGDVYAPSFEPVG